jgi:hypothetical protein
MKQHHFHWPKLTQLARDPALANLLKKKKAN